MATLRQRGPAPEKFTSNQEDCTTVHKYEDKYLLIQQDSLCTHGKGNGICIKIMYPGVADYTELPSQRSDQMLSITLWNSEQTQLNRLSKIIISQDKKFTPGMMNSYAALKGT